MKAGIIAQVFRAPVVTAMPEVARPAVINPARRARQLRTAPA